jgi:hypothetical protein
VHLIRTRVAHFLTLSNFVVKTVSLVCDGAISNMSEGIMNNFGVGQDEFIFRMYSIALVAIAGAAVVKGDMVDGITFMMHPGTYAEQQSNVPMDERSWTSFAKFMVMLVSLGHGLFVKESQSNHFLMRSQLFSSMGFFGSSCSAAITKNFGALTMSITSTARKATTLFLSFVLFDNKCTFEHVGGMLVFISALTAKSLRRKNKRRKSDGIALSSLRRRPADVEGGSLLPPTTNLLDGADGLASSSHGSLGTESLTNASHRRVGKQNSHRSTSPTYRANGYAPNGHHYVV